MLILSCMSCMCFAKHMHRPVYRPHNVNHRHVHHRPIIHSPKHVHHRHHHHSIIPFTIGALTGYTFSQLISPQPKTVVVQQPIVVAPTQTTIWEPGHYEDQIQPNGTIIRVWIPGRYVTKVITP
jgi:hypothetical protein